MKKSTLHHAQSGIAHLGMILFVVVVLGAIGFVGYRVTSQSDETNNTSTTAPITAEEASSDNIDVEADKAINQDDAAANKAAAEDEGDEQ
jgi:hypothetical protein